MFTPIQEASDIILDPFNNDSSHVPAGPMWNVLKKDFDRSVEILVPFRLRPQICACLAQIAKHSVDLAEVVVEADIFPKILTALKVMLF